MSVRQWQIVEVYKRKRDAERARTQLQKRSSVNFRYPPVPTMVRRIVVKKVGPRWALYKG